MPEGRDAIRLRFWDQYKEHIESVAVREEPGTFRWWIDVGVLDLFEAVDHLPDEFEGHEVMLHAVPRAQVALAPQPTREELVERAGQNLVDNVHAVRVVASDLQHALALIAKCQNDLSRLCAPDPNINEANPLLKKYGETPGERNKAFAVLVDGLDISDVSELAEGESIFDHPIFDVEGTVAEDQAELPPPPKQLEP